MCRIAGETRRIRRIRQQIRSTRTRLVHQRSCLKRTSLSPQRGLISARRPVSKSKTVSKARHTTNPLVQRGLGWLPRPSVSRSRISSYPATTAPSHVPPAANPPMTSLRWWAPRCALPNPIKTTSTAAPTVGTARLPEPIGAASPSGRVRRGSRATGGAPVFSTAPCGSRRR